MRSQEQSFICVIMEYSIRRWDCVHTATKALPWRSHCVLSRSYVEFLLAIACDRTDLPSRSLQSHGALAALLETLLRCYGDRTSRDGVKFVHVQNKRRPSEFCRVLCDLTVLPRRFHGVAYDRTALTSAFYTC